MDLAKDKIHSQYLKDIQRYKTKGGHYSPLPSIVTLHLYVEYIINSLIKEYCKNQARILDDSRTYSFSVKLNLIHEMEIIPTWLFTNIAILNKIRNAYSHDIEFDIIEFQGLRDFLLPDDQNNLEPFNIAALLDKRKKNENRSMVAAFWIPMATLMLLLSPTLIGKKK